MYTIFMKNISRTSLFFSLTFPEFPGWVYRIEMTDQLWWLIFFLIILFSCVGKSHFYYGIYDRVYSPLPPSSHEEP